LTLANTEHERAVMSQTSYTVCFRGSNLRGSNLRGTPTVIGIYCCQVLSGSNLRASSTYFLQQAVLPTFKSFDMITVNNVFALAGGLCTICLLFSTGPLLIITHNKTTATVGQQYVF